MPKQKRDKVYAILSEIEDQLNRQNSLKRVFLLGLFRGLGTALGATVLLAIVTSLAINFFDAVSIETIMQYFFNEALSE